MTSNVAFTDVTNTTLQIVAEEQAAIILSLTSEQRRWSKLFADTIKNPHEIYKFWRRDPQDNENHLLIRAYLQSVDLSAIENAQPFGIAVVEWVWEKGWKIYRMEMLLGELAAITEQVNQTIRFGERLYVKNS